MATNRDLLKEAIADAKAVKEMAIANAKTALEEAFTPRLKEMLSAKIQEMDEEMKYEEDMDEEMKYEEDMDEMKHKEDMDEMMYDEDMDEMKHKEDMDEMKYEEDMDEEMNLEELLAELEEEEKVDEGKKSDDKDDVKEGMYMEDDDDMDDDDMDGEGEPLDLEDMTDEDLKKMIEDVISDMVASGELEGGDVEDEEEGEEMEMSDEEEVDLTELLKEIEEEMTEEKELDEIEGVLLPDAVEFGSGILIAAAPFIATALGISVALVKDKRKGAKSKKEALAKVKDLKDDKGVSEEMSELQAEVKSLKSDLNEAVKETNATNLLNAKLLYSNKIFKAKNLNENQKIKVLSSFDKANTTKEAKLIYETLNEGLKVKKSTIKENLGRASKATTIPTTKKPIVESNEVFARMQKLAGIIK